VKFWEFRVYRWGLKKISIAEKISAEFSLPRAAARHKPKIPPGRLFISSQIPKSTTKFSTYADLVPNAGAAQASCLPNPNHHIDHPPTIAGLSIADLVVVVLVVGGAC
jgi:hypothetical protein